MEEYKPENSRKMTIDLIQMSKTINLLTLMIFIVALVPYLFIWRGEGHGLSSVFTSFTNLLVFILATIIGFVVHELIHGITWACVAEHGFRNISFGIIWKPFMPYCHCSKPMKIRHYMIGALMPCIVLGVIPVIVAYIIGNPMLLLLGAGFIAVALGDILIVWLIRKEDRHCMVLDHPTEPGCYIID